MVYPDGGDVGSFPMDSRSNNPGMAGHDAVRPPSDQNGVYKTKFLDVGGDLFDLPGCVGADIETGFELSWVFVFDGQRLFAVPHAPASNRENRRIF